MSIKQGSTDSKVFVELVKNETHAVHETVHVRGFSFVVGRPLVCGESGLERFEVLHPFHSKVMRLNIGFVEDKNEGQFGFIQNTAKEDVSMRHASEGDKTSLYTPACVKHVGHERCWGSRARCIDNIGYDGWQRRRDCVRDNGARSRPGENLYLTRSIQDDIANKTPGINQYRERDLATNNPLDSFRTLLHELQDLVKLGGEEVEGGQDASIRAEVVPS